ncbi:hypothetical protein BWZ22_12410 [Seonamhaeicola sp. S2-3]|uniref:hypothetical protein n=1 Tax=Seonamhaeicola sp. S2-3 TaxID=1936081 RepID=UPI000972E54E|nr:hypothetical protein [Seonamhaeicola sp. S2-3]APY11982.1 hypothetical protein BWZ22_12410 [Seonamhaeicola sp. S2-3]
MLYSKGCIDQLIKAIILNNKGTYRCIRINKHKDSMSCNIIGRSLKEYKSYDESLVIETLKVSLNK